ncbi:MAG TPA: hypothetical protein GX523_15025 [Desulfitobacterium dehalogenans]|uniref:Uncharacterized protein n=1 Tax=Desulfitobacterium dehalogenans TaxID=36854 RepID=A0A7C7D7A2_9FIRM|nr:hypothetical protein [Desulfitobacterium dehalogenans]
MHKAKLAQSLVVILLIFVVIAGSIGLSSGMTKEELEYRPLTLSEVTKLFSQKGLKLESVGREGFEDTALFGIEPEVFRIHNSEDLVFIYPFSSHGERKKLAGHYWRFNAEMMDMFLPYSQLFQTLVAKNMFIVYCPLLDEESFKAIGPAYTSYVQRSKAIAELVLRDLNGGKTLIFRGEGHYWQVEVVLNYFNQFYKDDRGVLGYDSWSEESAVAKYKGNPSQVKWFNYIVEGTSGSFFGGTQHTLRPDGFASLGRGSGLVNKAEGRYSFSIKWNGQGETFDLEVDPFGMKRLSY